MFDAQCDVAALVYDRDQCPDEVLLNFVAELQRRGRRPVGLVQLGHHDAGTVAMPARMVHSGRQFNLFQDAERYRAGRRLDLERLVQVRREMMAEIDRGADLLVVNRFGRQEREGRGLAQLIEHALRADVPVIVPVPAFYFNDWIAYVAGMCVKLPCDAEALDQWWKGLAARGGPPPRHLQHNVCEALK